MKHKYLTGMLRKVYNIKFILLSKCGENVVVGIEYKMIEAKDLLSYVIQNGQVIACTGYTSISYSLCHHS